MTIHRISLAQIIAKPQIVRPEQPWGLVALLLLC